MLIVPPMRALTTFALVSATPVLLQAHPGHDHGDLPAVIRHPFASPEHLVVTVVVLGSLVGAGWLIRRALRARRSAASAR